MKHRLPEALKEEKSMTKQSGTLTVTDVGAKKCNRGITLEWLAEKRLNPGPDEPGYALPLQTV